MFFFTSKWTDDFIMLNQLTYNYNAFHILSCSPFLFSQEHYKDLKDKPFFPKLIDYITSGPVVCMVYTFLMN